MKNIEKNQITDGLNIKEYGEENINYINKNPKLLEMVKLFNKINEESKLNIDIKNSIIKISEIDNSNKNLKLLKKTLKKVS